MARFVPKVGDALNVQLPGELLRAEVTDVVTENLCIVKLSLSVPFSKVHQHQKDDIIPVRRETGDFGQEVWKEVSMAEFNAAAQAEAHQAEQKQAEGGSPPEAA